MDKNEMMILEFFPTIDDIEEKNQYTKISVDNLVDWGMTLSELSQHDHTIKKTIHTSGLYKVDIPAGGQLAKFKDGSGYLGTVLKDGKISSQARINPMDMVEETVTIPINPYIMGAAIMLKHIDSKLDLIQETSQQILSTINTIEHGDIQGNMKMLYDVVSHLKMKWDDTSFKADYRIKAIDIKQKAYQDIEKYKERIQKALNKKKGLSLDGISDRTLNELVDSFKYYRLSVYIFCYSSFVEFILGESYSNDILNADLQAFNVKSMEYKNLYTQAYNQLEEKAQKSIASLALSGAGIASKALGKTIHKIPVIEKGPVDEALMSLGDKANSFKDKNVVDALSDLRNYKDLNIGEFKDQYAKIDMIYNQPLSFMFDTQNNVYVHSKLLA